MSSNTIDASSIKFQPHEHKIVLNSNTKGFEAAWQRKCDYGESINWDDTEHLLKTAHKIWTPPAYIDLEIEYEPKTREEPSRGEKYGNPLPPFEVLQDLFREFNRVSGSDPVETMLAEAEPFEFPRGNIHIHKQEQTKLWGYAAQITFENSNSRDPNRNGIRAYRVSVVRKYMTAFTDRHNPLMPHAAQLAADFLEGFFGCRNKDGKFQYFSNHIADVEAVLTAVLRLEREQG